MQALNESQQSKIERCRDALTIYARRNGEPVIGDGSASETRGRVGQLEILAYNKLSRPIEIGRDVRLCWG
jgi:hypothetical protein